MPTMILLVGEQPIPNLLPVLHEKPDDVLLVYTDRTKVQTERLQKLLENRCRAETLQVSAFDIVQTQTDLGARLTERGWRGPQTVFNLTGGTKTMAFAAYELAVRLGSDFLYLQTEGGQSLIYRYMTSRGAPVLSGSPQVVKPLLTIDDYLRVHLGSYKVDGFSTTDGGRFEKAVHDALVPVVDEVMPGVRFSAAVEVDMVIRCGNQVGIAELKTGKPSKEAIGQLTTASGREYLGTYTKRYLITSRSWENLDDLKDLAMARDIVLIELLSYQQSGVISTDAIEKLRGEFVKTLRCKSAGGTA